MAAGEITAVLRSYGASVPPNTGGWQKMHCPFHGDGNASAAVNVSAGRFRCHGCMERSEDAIGLIQWWEDISYGLARDRYSGLAGVDIESVRGKPTRRAGFSKLLG